MFDGFLRWWLVLSCIQQAGRDWKNFAGINIVYGFAILINPSIRRERKQKARNPGFYLVFAAYLLYIYLNAKTNGSDFLGEYINTMIITTKIIVILFSPKQESKTKSLSLSLSGGYCFTNWSVSPLLPPLKMGVYITTEVNVISMTWE